MFDMMKKLQEAQRQMKEIKDRLETVTVQATSSNGAITVRANGNRKILGIDFDSSAEMNSETFKSDLVETVNQAIAQADQVNESEMKGAASSMMPGLGGMFK